MPLALRLSEGLGHKLVVLAVCADPKPMNAFASWKPKRSIVQTYPDAIHFAAAE